MTLFSADDLTAIDRLWRSIPPDHVWTGWSACGEEPEEVIIYRTRAHWRKFPLRKASQGYSLFDERGRELASALTLDALLSEVEALPGLNEAL
jgi:hypothetical protein